MPILLRITLCILLFTGQGFLRAQEPKLTKLDLAVTYIGERSVKANTSQNFWMQGGSIELGANVVRGWGIAANVTGTHAGSIGASGLPLSQVMCKTIFASVPGSCFASHADIANA